ncbi:MAG TPA: Uma2 family endonuclease [Chthonomonadaceae bacterium]|nr:Uma2 family endonuclease [Chthonomonadaceae bacterium]
MSKPLLEEQFSGVVELGIKLERVGGLTVWEAQPVLRHQKAVFRIQQSIRPVSEEGDCGCFQYADLSILFPDGSEKRPDISIFCCEPDEEDESVSMLPEAVIEIISKGYEAKDFEVGVPFYLAQGVKDVITLDPRSNEVHLFRRNSTSQHLSPVEIVLECGCVCTV